MMQEKTRIGIGFGSNLGHCEDNIRNAIVLLGQSGLGKIKISSFIETNPVGFESSNIFKNCVGLFETLLQPQEVLTILMDTEQKLGRIRRDASGYIDRIIDLDLLFYGELIYNDEELVLPHPRLHERDFVLLPLCEVYAHWMHPLLNQTVKELLENRQREDSK